MAQDIRRVEGMITRDDGTTASFTIDSEGYHQWGQNTEGLAPNVPALTAMHGALADHLTDRYRQT